MKHEQLRNINDQREILRIEKAKKKAKIEEFRAWDGWSLSTMIKLILH